MDTTGNDEMGPGFVTVGAPPTPFIRLTCTTSQTETVSFVVFAYRPS
jgi:hypothetical protein